MRWEDAEWEQESVDAKEWQRTVGEEFGIQEEKRRRGENI